MRNAARCGLGVGGFCRQERTTPDSILQWHHLASEVYPVTTVAGLERNTLGDGLFHGAAHVFTVAGLFLLWSVARRQHAAWSAGLLVGTLLVGWGVSNVVEGIADHHSLRIHYVRPGSDRLAYGLAFLAWGALMLVRGWALVQRGLRKLSAAAATAQR